MTEFPMTAFESCQAIVGQTYHEAVSKVTLAGYAETYEVNGLVFVLPHDSTTSEPTKVLNVAKDATAIAYLLGWERDEHDRTSYCFYPIYEGTTVPVRFMTASCWCHFHSRVKEMVGDICLRHADEILGRGLKFELVCIKTSRRSSSVCIVLVERKELT